MRKYGHECKNFQAACPCKEIGQELEKLVLLLLLI